jgi:hypothetical protein
VSVIKCIAIRPAGLVAVILSSAGCRALGADPGHPWPVPRLMYDVVCGPERRPARAIGLANAAWGR